MPLRLTTWNLEWFGKLLQGRERTLNGRKVTSAAGKALQRLQKEKIAEEIRALDPDILCIQEGPSTGNAKDLRDYCAEFLEGRWTVIERPAGGVYHVRGSQGIWFLVRTARLASLSPQLLPVERWWEATEAQSRIGEAPVGEHGRTWPVNHPWFKPESPPALPDVPDDDDAGDPPPAADFSDRTHFHWRWPQVLVCTTGGKRVDFIGVHLKSKFGGETYVPAAAARRRQLDGTATAADNALVRAVEQAATEARIKLSTEIANIRYYIDHRFGEEPDPAIFVLGDMNDGIGKEYWERRYLFHDLISNLQGDIFFARRFLNHALFDYDPSGDGSNYRWTAKFRDAWDPFRPEEILLDHIVFTQGVVGAEALAKTGLRVRAGAGRVEHQIHSAVNSAFPGAEAQTSDHRPVTVDIQMAGDPVA